MLVSSCWQSGLDYSDFAGDFADIFITGDYMTALECFTVLEESAVNIEVSKKSALSEKLKSSIHTFSRDKIALAEALIVVLC